ncbi:CPSF A subunit region [Phytophthora infestans]|uniref:CPSF A subunit region n=1 Tax=Phytophthora infestans TaxID=4787 RepID=A0A833WLZ5_PHYIN|nr:CPSF A subunit region [Phytophthora infestans]
MFADYRRDRPHALERTSSASGDVVEFRVHFERYEVVLSVKHVSVRLVSDEGGSGVDVSEWNKKKRPYLVVGTGWYVNEEGGATSGEAAQAATGIHQGAQTGAISMVSQLGPYVLAAVGSKLIVYEFKSEQLIGCAFYDAQMYIVTLSVVKDFVMYGDVYKSVHFLRWRGRCRGELVLLAKDYEPLAVSATEFSVFEKKLALLAVDMDENLHVMQFARRISSLAVASVCCA